MNFSYFLCYNKNIEIHGKEGSQKPEVKFVSRESYLVSRVIEDNVEHIWLLG